MEPGEAPRGYLVVVARNAGVPPDLIDDAVQEQLIAIWRAPGIPWKTVAIRQVQDFVRRYLWDPRIKTPTPTFVDIDEEDLVGLLGVDVENARDRQTETSAFLARVLYAIEALHPSERDCLLEQGFHPGERKLHKSHSSNVYQARRKLRALIPDRPSWW